jgi:UDP-N-acetylglucosamine 2-epimerase (non-hydrolysing)
MPLKPLFIFGTRPEAIKLCPIVRHMKGRPDDFDVRVCVTGQHREMLDQVLSAFEVRPDRDLDIMSPGQSLYQSTSRIIGALESVLFDERPDIAVVQGDTTTTFCGALAAFYSKIPVGHVEAGLRTNDIYRPFPEEVNRRLVGQLATVHFAATEEAAQNLYREGMDRASITVTGNTGIDAVLLVKKGLKTGRLVGLDGSLPKSSKKLIVVTAHRRESFGEGFDRICAALLRIARRDDVEIVYPVHPNPNVRATVNQRLAGQPNITLMEPLEYIPFVDLMQRAYFLLTDSGGIQEEAPSLGKPVLVLRENTERPEAVHAGTAKLVGTNERRIVEEAEQLLDDPEAYRQMARGHSPYGDGRASQRIADFLISGKLNLDGSRERSPQRSELEEQVSSS